MQIMIELNDKQCKELISKELTDLPKETLQSIIVDALHQYLTDRNVADSLFTTTSGYYGAKIPSRFLLDVVEKDTDLKPLTTELSNLIIDYIREHKDKIIPNIIMNIFMAGISNSDVIRNSLSEVSEAVCNREITSLRNTFESK